MICKRGEFKGHKTIGFWMTEEDKIPALSMGVKKVQVALNHVRELVQFVLDEGGTVPAELLPLIDAGSKKTGKK